MADTSDFRNGFTMVIDGTIFSIAEFQHVKPGKGGAFVRTKLRNVQTGAVLDRTFRSGDKVDEVRLEKREMQFLYSDSDGYHFMDTETYEQTRLTVDALGGSVKYLLADATIVVESFEGEPIGIQLPLTVDLEVKETAPAIKGATANAQLKPATLETGLVVQVPPFVANGDRVRVNTETGEYQSRV